MMTRSRYMAKRCWTMGLVAILCQLCWVASDAQAGDLVPTYAPDEAGSAMFSGRDLLNRLESGTNAPLRTGSFAGPTAGTTAGTMPTLNEIMAAAPATNAAAALPGEVLAGKVYWGLVESDWGTQTGTVATVMLSHTTTVVQAGYYAATNLTLVDTNLVAANIKEGATIFGVTGTREDMALIPAGDFVKTDSPDGVNFVTNYVSAFYMSRTHITKAQWDAVRSWASTNGYTDLPVGGGKGVDHPVQRVSWYAAVKWCNARSEMEGRTPAYYTGDTHATVYRTGDLDLLNAWVRWDTGYRLPTETEWEKAARGGLYAHRFPWGDTTNKISHAQANFRNDGVEAYRYGTTGYHPSYNTGAEPYTTSPVGSFAPNGYGLYDMSGNVWGWCWDRYFESGYYVVGSDLRGPDSGSDRVIRGGSSGADATHCRVGHRLNNNPYYASIGIGFRAVLPPGQP